jgi:hypothetical protein
MTTEPRQERRGPRLHPTTLELRLYLVAVLAAAYTLAWRASGGHAPPVVAPAVTLPSASPAPPPPPPPRAVVRAPTRHAPARRAPRARTRSS